MSLHRDGELAIVQIGLQCGADVPGNRPLRLLGYVPSVDSGVAAS